MSSEFYAKGAHGYSMLANSINDSRVKNLVAALEPHLARRMLDVGCGDMALSQICPNMHWTGIDIRPRCERGVSHDLTKTPWPFEDQAFDVVLCSEVLEHLFDPVACIKEMHRLLVSDGKLIVTVPNFNNLDFIKAQHVEQVFNPNVEHSVEHIRNYTPISMRWLLEQSGFIFDGYTGNSPHLCYALQPSRDALKVKLPDMSQIDRDVFLGEILPDYCPGFMMIARKK